MVTKRDVRSKGRTVAPACSSKLRSQELRILLLLLLVVVVVVVVVVVQTFNYTVIFQRPKCVAARSGKGRGSCQFL